MDGALQGAQQQQPAQQPAPPAQPAHPAPASNADAHKQQHVQPVRSFLPSASLAAAEKSLFPNSMPVRQLPGIHSFAPSPANSSPAGGAASPAGPANAGKAGSPAGSAGGAGTPMGLSAGQARVPGGEQKRFGAGSVSPYGAMPSRSPNLAPASSAAPNSHTTPTPPIIPGPASGLSPPLAASSSGPAQRPLPSLTSPLPPAATATPGSATSPPPPHQPGPPTSSASTTAGRTAGNPMSVSSMLSGPPRDRPVSAYSPLANAGGASAAGRAGSPPQPPVLPPASTAGGVVDGTQKSPQMQRQQGAPPATQPGTTLPAYVVSSASNPAPSTKAAVEPPPSSALGAARSSYPPLPSAFARENPYSPSTTSGATSGTATPATAKAHAAGPNVQISQQHQRDAAAVEVKKSLFPALGLGGAGMYGRPTVPGVATGARTTGAAATEAGQGATGSSGQPYPWQAQAAQQAQQVLAAQQQQQAQQAGGRKAASSRPGATTSVSAPAAPTVGAGRGGPTAVGVKGAAGKLPQQHHQLQQQQQQRYPPPPALDPYGGARNVQPPPSSAAPTPSHAPPAAPGVNGHTTKRRRSDASEQQQATAPPARRQKSVTPPPLAPPLFTHIELRKAMIYPPVVEILNRAVDEWAKNSVKEGEGERRFLGRVTYDALVSPAKLLDGGVLARGVGGYVEVVVPTTWILGPHRLSAPSLANPPIQSSCSVPPIDLHPVVFDIGPPSAYNGEPLPFTLSTTPLLLPSHLADLPSIRKREVWGTDVYTDDSDVLAMLLHSGWLRVTRRERRVKAGEKGAGADAIRRARIPGEERIVLPPTDGEEKGVPKALCVKLGVVPALVRYEGIERQGIRSRSWGNGHDGVSLRIEEVKPLDDVPPEPVRRTRKTRAALCAHQCAELYHDDFSHHDDHHAPAIPPAKRYRFAADPPALVNGDGPAADRSELLVSDTFVIDALSGRGTFVGLNEENERGTGFERVQGEGRMEVEAAA
ncbi:hypothetical protein NBRC10513v2_000765 [Rhodotorula toruloides]|uniref:BY PROTMAP: gi/472581562/gb/EMS19290.1/ Histone deacetylation protein Rxt3 [Rhodosporidium toruloides NP11] gi/647403087/emb/CDR49261.1/ RHTO0S24e02058g1_1 [Rhodosporidium toruloides] n=1 Tax=Rhodotorula toruloides TaxID=5286 RepID=A0A0K3CJW3_RHOTO